MFSHLILAPSYRLLLDRLLGEIRSTASAGRLTSQWIVTSSSTLAAELRILLARESDAGVIAGVRIIPVLPFVDRLSELIDAAPGARWSPLFDLLLYRLLEQEQVPELVALSELRGGQDLLRPAFLDLADAGFGLEQLEVLQEVIDLSETDGTTREVLRLYLTWLHLLDRAEITWGPLSCQQLGEKISQVPDAQLSTLLGETQLADIRVHVYGFYEFTDVAEQVLSALARRVSTSFYLPFYRPDGKTHHAFEFAEPIIEALRLRLGSAAANIETLEPDGQAPLRFFLSTFPEGQIASQPGFLTYQRASGLRAEVVSAAVQVQRWLDDARLGLDPREIHVVAPQAGLYSDLIREIFPSFAIPLRLAEVPNDLSPSARALRSIVRLWEDQAPTESVLGLFRDFPNLGCLRAIELNSFETKLRKAGFDGRNWAGLQEHRGSVGLTESEAALVDEIVQLWTRIPAPVSQVLLTVTEALSRLERIAERWLPDSDLLTALVDTLKVLPGDLRFPLTVLLGLLESQAGDTALDDPPEKNGVLFAPLMRTRGLAPRAVVLLGLASGRLPFVVQEDPLMGDAVRLNLGRLVRDLGHRLTLRTAVAEEMALLFVLVNGSSEYVHWVIPDTDENGRGLAPTPWVQRYLQRWESSPPEPRPTYSRPHVPLPRGPAEQARVLLGLDPVHGRFLPPTWSAHLDRDSGVGTGSVNYSDILGSLTEKEHEPRWNGFIPQAALGSGTAIVRVTELERLSRCPFQGYNRMIAGWEALWPLDFTQDVKATEWGSLLHALFERTVGEYRDAGLTLKAMAGALLEDDCRSLIRQIEELPDDASLQLPLLPPLFRKAAKAKLLQLAREYWEAVQAGAIPDGNNICTEKRCNAQFPGLEGVQVSGQLDRMDDRRDHFVIIDYKSGREPETLQTEVRNGFRLQPLLYPWLHQMSGEGPGKPTRFSYVFFGKSPVQEKSVCAEQSDSIEDWLALFARILREGAYVACSNEALELLGIEKAEPCQYCEYPSLCRRFERQAPARIARFLTQFLPERLAKFQGKGD
ncbi:MAG: PD-(D/E)XK nuclease family protein [Acidobacteria bacterium]|nr:MAG: PD-(D/E)XK nuclease family protein [Acidobacteriota bacterium]